MRYLLLTTVLFTGCIANDGSEGAMCYPNATCNAPLVCLKKKGAASGTCFDLIDLTIDGEVAHLKKPAR